MQISHEAIYRSLFIQTRGVLKKELTAHSRTARRMRHPKSHNVKSGQGHILDMVSVRERPAEVEDRAVAGLGKETFLPERTIPGARSCCRLRDSTNWRGHDDVMQIRSFRGSGEPVWVSAL
jgi:hypothetical protein